MAPSIRPSIAIIGLLCMLLSAASSAKGLHVSSELHRAAAETADPNQQQVCDTITEESFTDAPTTTESFTDAYPSDEDEDARRPFRLNIFGGRGGSNVRPDQPYQPVPNKPPVTEAPLPPVQPSKLDKLIAKLTPKP